MSDRDTLTGTISGKKISGSVNSSQISGSIGNASSLSGSAQIDEKIEYSNIRNRPYIEGQELKAGDNDYEEIGLNRLTNSEIEEIFTR